MSNLHASMAPLASSDSVHALQPSCCADPLLTLQSSRRFFLMVLTGSLHALQPPCGVNPLLKLGAW
ncbi:hypothetical protein DUNSADRAFT_14526 [Dunaliella salina]|uniref:Uncharacterized protein n=1 Tax=Dunaliella salina TaxID=3046 RepID=A0ABQ7G7A3_DUNSA|nr:hypothetical protein DUNSADRAFT_14526 [Dunaliella salina]|eukprot:KAF5830485.1 hypothetical protein DUNSADRAFT_14526 [Dunaliella salina]